MYLQPKKSLGQNFLKSKNVLDKIIEVSEIKDTDIILEVGPGKGFLTEKILEKAEKVIVVEKDNRLISLLKEKFEKEINSKKLELIEGDILDFNETKINGNYKVIANIPYYITGQIIKKFLSSKKQPKKMVLMIQKQVAERIVDKPESILSISVKVYGKPKYIKTVKAVNFKPKPKVDSVILSINDISKDIFVKNDIKEENFFKILRKGFSHKRKLVINNLSNNKEKKVLEKIFKTNNLSLKLRAQDLSVKDWINIVKNLY